MRRRIIRQLFAVFMLLLGLTFNGQVFAARLPVKIYTSADGLGSSFIDYLMADSRGFMWFCTRDGLSRFDGSHFVTYQIVVGSNSPPGIESLYEAKDGTYWINSTGGVLHFDPGKISAPNGSTPTLNAEYVTGNRGQLFEDHNGTFWLGTAGLYKIEPHDGKYDIIRVLLNLPEKPKSAFVVADLRETADGSLWINSTWGLVRRLPDERIVFYPDDDKRELSTGSLRMIIDKNGRIWLSRANILYVIKPDALESLNSPDPITIKPLVPTTIADVVAEHEVPLPKVGGEIIQFKNNDLIDKWPAKQLFQTSDGNVWIAAEECLLQIAGGVLHVHTTAEGLPNTMQRIAEDSVGNLWVAGNTGLVRLDRSGMVTFGKADGASSDRFYAINEGPGGTMFFASPDAHIAEFDGKAFKSARPAVDPKAIHLWMSRYAFLDSNGDWWILTGTKLYRFSGVKNIAELDGKAPTATYTSEEGLKSNGMFEIFEDSYKDIWVSTRGADATGHGIARLRKGESRFVAFSEADGLPPGKSASSYAQDKNGNVWVGFYEGGLARFDGEKFRVFTAETGLPMSGVITDLHIDIRGRLWISSASNGLARIDDPSAETPIYSRFSTADGLSSNNVRTITEDRFGRIYAGTVRGVDRISPDTGRVKHYSINDGLAADFVVDSHCDKEGNLWFATNNGISRLIPTPDEKALPPKIWLGGLRIAGEYQPTAELGSSDIEKGELSASQNNLEIDYYGIDFRAGELLRYQYKLEGADADWSQPSELRTVTYANLQPATYRFLVRAINSDGVASETLASVSFKILPPIWERWWFVLGALLLVFGVVVVVYRYRTARLREVNIALSEAREAEENLSRSRQERIAELEKVRSRIATDLHDDIGASLTQIVVLSEVAQAGSKGNATSAPLTKISEVSNELVGTMSDIVWSINPTKDHISDLTQRMRRFASDVLTSRSIRFHFEANEDAATIVIGSNLRRELYLIFKESINNIAKHADAKNVWTEMDFSGGTLTLTIKDDGNGFDPLDASIAENGNGLASMRRRTQETGGQFDLHSAPGKPTEIKVRFPVESLTSTVS